MGDDGMTDPVSASSRRLVCNLGELIPQGGDMVDADAIFVVKLLESLLDRTASYNPERWINSEASAGMMFERPRPMIFVELVRGENAKFIPLNPTLAPARSGDSRGDNYQLGIEVGPAPLELL